MSNKSGAMGMVVGVAMGMAVGLAAALIYAARSEERARELLREEGEKARYRSPEYAEHARDAIMKARKRAKAKLDDD